MQQQASIEVSMHLHRWVLAAACPTRDASLAAWQPTNSP